ncbi:MAG: hypothetical protein ACOCYP_04550 [Planctomycetota bacterium]
MAAASSSSDPRPVAVIDCGSTEVRCVIAEVRPEGHRVLDEMSAACDLTGGFAQGTLSRRAMDHVVGIISGMQVAVASYGVTEVMAVATSALREAANADVILERLRVEAELTVRVIDASEESQLYFQALDQVCGQFGFCFSGDVLTLDIGGGTSVVGLIRGGKLVHSIDEHFSTRRTIENFAGLIESVEFVGAVDRYCNGAARVMMRRLPSVRHPALVVTGREPRNLVWRLFNRIDAGVPAYPVEAITNWRREQIGMTRAERARFIDTDPVEADEMLSAGAIICHLARINGADQVHVPRLRLCDGLLAGFDIDPRRAEREWRKQLLAAGRQLAVRYGTPRAYANNTARLARQIFEQTRALHGLGSRECALLEFAALAHDVGAHINVRSRHKHTYYIIRHADIPGLREEDQEVVALVARYHRRSSPVYRHAEFTRLPRASRVLVSILAGILRLAYALDVERCQRIRSVTVRVEGQTLLLLVERRDVTLERWSVEDKARLFTDMMGLRVVVLPGEGE